MIKAKIIADSIANDVRLTTLQLRYPRFIHSEFMTHRVFSRNASSSRAIPVEKMLDTIESDPAMPIHWGANKAGMQADMELTGDELESVKEEWEYAVKSAIGSASFMANNGAHKQIVNRITEPYQHISVVVTATEWTNFFALRDHPAAQPEIQALAKAMRKAMDESTPIELNVGDFHLPYVGCFNGQYFSKLVDEEVWSTEISEEEAIKCSVARCARVSYLNHDQSNPDIDKDIALADKLLSMGHMSPFEHQATPIDYRTIYDRRNPQQWQNITGITHEDRMEELWSGNLKGWLQWRHML